MKTEKTQRKNKHNTLLKQGTLRLPRSHLKSGKSNHHRVPLTYQAKITQKVFSILLPVQIT